jgi:hypothetical protein
VRLQRRLPAGDYYAGRDHRTLGRIYCRRQVGSLKATLEFIYVMSADKDSPAARPSNGLPQARLSGPWSAADRIKSNEDHSREWAREARSKRI